MFTLGVICGAIAASIPWWIHVRGLQGVKSDLQDVASDAKNVADKVKQ